MGTDDGINTLRRIPCLSELREEWPLSLVPRGNAPFFIIADARVHQNALLGDFHYQRMYTAHSLTVGRQKWDQPWDAGEVIDRRLWHDEAHAWRFQLLDTGDAYGPHLPV